MKTKSIFSTLLFALAFAFLTSCSGNQKEGSHDDHGDKATPEASPGSSVMEAADPQFKVDETFQKQLGNVFTAYVSLKDAFVSSDPEKVRTESSATKDALDKIDMKLVSGAAHHDWMNYQTGISNSLETIESVSSIEAQRKSFRSLSDQMYKSIKAFGLGGKEAYYEFCPMAFNDEGGYWLSDDKQIRNPYYGEKMLTCGEVKEKLK